MVASKPKTAQCATIALKLSSQGQVTIPKQIREELGVGPGDEVVIRRDAKGHLSLEGRRRLTVAEMAGSVPNRGRAFPNVSEAWERALDEKAERILGTG